jgi:hypothetical protein
VLELQEEPLVQLDKENVTPFLAYPGMSSTTHVLALLPEQVTFDAQDDSGSFRSMEEDPRESKRPKKAPTPAVDSQYYQTDAQYHFDVVTKNNREVWFWGMPGEPQFLQHCNKYGRIHEVFDPTGFIRKHYEKLEAAYDEQQMELAARDDQKKFQRELENF